MQGLRDVAKEVNQEFQGLIDIFSGQSGVLNAFCVVFNRGYDAFAVVAISIVVDIAGPRRVVFSVDEAST